MSMGYTAGDCIDHGAPRFTWRVTLLMEVTLFIWLWGWCTHVMGVDLVDRGIHKILKKLCCLCGRAHKWENMSWGVTWCLLLSPHLSGAHTVYKGCTACMGSTPFIWVALLCEVHIVYERCTVLHGVHVIYEGCLICMSFLWAMLFLSTVSLGCTLSTWESQCIWVFISFMDSVLSVWVLTVEWYQLCVYSVHVSKYVSPACSMADQGLSTSDKWGKKTHQTPVFVELTLSRTSTPHLCGSHPGSDFWGLCWHQLSRRVSPCVWGYIHWYHIEV